MVERSREHPAEDPERGDNDRLEDEDLDIGPGHRRVGLGLGFSAHGSGFMVQASQYRAPLGERLLRLRERLDRGGPPRLVGVEPRARRSGRAAGFFRRWTAERRADLDKMP